LVLTAVAAALQSVVATAVVAVAPLRMAAPEAPPPLRRVAAFRLAHHERRGHGGVGPAHRRRRHGGGRVVRQHPVPGGAEARLVVSGGEPELRPVAIGSPAPVAASATAAGSVVLSGLEDVGRIPGS
jgi:hypothetical protein